MTIVTDLNLKDTACEAHFGQRINAIIEYQGLSKAWVAEKLGISKQALNYLLKHSVKPKLVDEFAELLRMDPQWLETGIGDPSGTSVTSQKTLSIPVLNKKELIEQREHQRMSTSAESIELSSPHAKNCLAYKIEDNSNFPPFIHGSILIFDKKKEPVNGDYVLFMMDNEVFVRQYLIDGKNICLKTNSMEHKTFINPKIQILGVLFEARYFIR